MLMIRLRRGGGRNRPFFRLIVSDSAMQPKGRFVENLGSYHPGRKQDSLEVDWDRIDHWIRMGANPSETVKRLISKGRPAAT